MPDPALGQAERLRTLAELLPVLEAPDADVGDWDTRPAADGTGHLPWFTPGPTADAVLAAVGRGGWLIPGFDWRGWLDTDRGRELRVDPLAVDTASPDELARLITAIVRSDRLVEGSLEGAFESGLLAGIARRAAALLDALP